MTYNDVLNPEVLLIAFRLEVGIPDARGAGRERDCLIHQVDRQGATMPPLVADFGEAEFWPARLLGGRLEKQY